MLRTRAKKEEAEVYLELMGWVVEAAVGRWWGDFEWERKGDAGAKKEGK